jgi:hypothetical protein
MIYGCDNSACQVKPKTKVDTPWDPEIFLNREIPDPSVSLAWFQGSQTRGNFDTSRGPFFQSQTAGNRGTIVL